MDIKKVNEYCNTLEWREVTADQPPCGIPVVVKTPHSYPMIGFRCASNDGPLNYFYSPAMRKNGYVANAKWRPLGGAEW